MTSNQCNPGDCEECKLNWDRSHQWNLSRPARDTISDSSEIGLLEFYPTYCLRGKWI